ncbi:GNAT family N-acetyltransferase [Nonomuraea africana]|uniref:RimJ/RimL family protein N-acetyltransferase n=1 Tax=Nonomuraea africana TaxID=46171 RepID=A0ABR9K6X5_9ACTN|nr:GNAT family protein [Nonomuraea africana]MBE1557754.1 RimJ/RimL family protein N-acetyltransferase [Nonomuraea africana]
MSVFDPRPRITTDRLVLRPFLPGDADAIRAAVRAGHRFLPPGAPGHVAAVADWLSAGVHELQRSGFGLHLAMVDDQERVVGAISLFRTQWGAGVTEVGYGVHPLHRGRGFATEALRGLSEWVFATTTLHRIELRTALTNSASIRVAEKAGYAYEGVLRAAEPADDGPQDLVVFGLLRGSTGAPNAFVHEELVTPRLVLRRFSAADVPDLTATAADDLTQLRTGLPRDYTEAHGRAYALSICEQHRLNGGGIAWAVAEKETGRFVASVDLKGTEWGHRATEVGYMTAPWARGKGYAGEAVLAIARWLFARHGFQRLQLRAAVSNLASQRVAEKAGFVREGVARNGAGGEDLVVFSLIPSDLP